VSVIVPRLQRGGARGRALCAAIPSLAGEKKEIIIVDDGF